MFVSVPHTNCDENQGSSGGGGGSSGEPILPGMMESVITDSLCPQADGNKLSHNYLWMRGQAAKICMISLPCLLRMPTEPGKVPNRIFFFLFLRSHLICLLSSAYLFSNQTKYNSHLQHIFTFVIRCGDRVGRQARRTIAGRLESQIKARMR